VNIHSFCKPHLVCGWRRGFIIISCLMIFGLELQPDPFAGQRKGSITPNLPAGISPAKNLTAKERLENFEFLWNAINITYPFFKLKSINWDEVRVQYKELLDAVKDDDGFYALMYRLMNELKDAHSQIENMKAPLLSDVGGVLIDLFEGKPIVSSVRRDSPFANVGVKLGWEVLSVDGMTPAEKLQALRPYLRACSSERAFQHQAIRSLLWGSQGSAIELKLRSPEGRMEMFSFRRDSAPMMGPAFHMVTFPMTQQRYVNFCKHASGLGYIWIRTFAGREEIVADFNRALDELRDTPGLILDIRGNAGGFGQPQIVSRLLRKRSLVSVQYIKNGKHENDFSQQEQYLEPNRP